MTVAPRACSKQLYEQYFDKLCRKNKESANEFNELRKIVKTFAQDLFQKHFEASDCLAQLAAAQTAPRTINDEQKNTVNDRIFDIAAFCHGEVLKANNQNIELTEAQTAAIQKQFDALAKTYEEFEKDSTEGPKFAAELKTLAEATPHIIKCSEAYISALNTFTGKALRDVIEGINLGKKSALKQTAFITKLFPESFCTKEMIQKLKDNAPLAGTSTLSFGLCCNSAAYTIASIAMKAQTEERELTGEEREAMKQALETLYATLDKIEVNAKNAESITKLQDKIANLDQEIIDLKTKLKELNAENNLFKAQAEKMKQFEDISASIKTGLKRREQEIKKTSTTLEKLSEKRGTLASQLTDAVKPEKGVATDVSAQTIRSFQRKINSAKTDMEAFAKVAMAYIQYAVAKADRQPEAVGFLWRMLGY